MRNLRHIVTGVDNSAGGTVTFTWDNPNDNSITKYKYRRSSSGEADGNIWGAEWTDAPGTASASVTFAPNLPANGGNVFYFQLRAVSVIDNSAINGPLTAVTVRRQNTHNSGHLSLSTGSNAAAAWDNTARRWGVTLTWTAPTNNVNNVIDKYQYRQRENNGNYGNWTDVNNGADPPVPVLESTAVSPFKVENLRAGRTYTFQLRAVDDDMENGEGEPVTLGPVVPGAPGQPTGLAYVADLSPDPNDANHAPEPGLHWTAPVHTDDDGITVSRYQYRYKAVGSTNWSGWANVSGGSGATKHSPRGLVPGVEYVFEVRALAGSVPGQPSNQARFTAAAPAEGPAAPRDLRIQVGNGKVTLSWRNPRDRNIIGYVYLQSAGGAASTEHRMNVELDDAPALTTYTVTDLTNLTEYTFQIKAENGRGFSEASNSVSATPQVVQGSWSHAVSITPGQIDSGGSDGATVSLAATYRVASADRGTVQRLASAGAGSSSASAPSFNPQLVGFGTGSSVSLVQSSAPVSSPGNCVFDTNAGTIKCVISYAVDGKALYAAPKAEDGTHTITVGLSNDFSLTALVNGNQTVPYRPTDNLDAQLKVKVPPPVVPKPAAPRGLQAGISDRSVTLTWNNPVDSSIQRYQYRRKAVSNSGWSPDWTNISGSHRNTVSYRMSGLSDGVRYEVQLRAVNSAGSGATAKKTFTKPSLPLPSRPRGLEAVISDRSVTLTWSYSGDSSIRRYQYRRKPTSESGWNPDWSNLGSSGSDTTRYRMNSLSNDVRYEAQLRAVNTTGAGPMSKIIFTPKGPVPVNTPAPEKVAPPNNAPEKVGRISDQALEEYGSPERVSLDDYFRDRDGDKLSYQAESGNPKVAAASISDGQVVTAPVVAGAALVTVTATDPGGLNDDQSFLVTVAHRVPAPPEPGEQELERAPVIPQPASPPRVAASPAARPTAPPPTPAPTPTPVPVLAAPEPIDAPPAPEPEAPALVVAPQEAVAAAPSEALEEPDGGFPFLLAGLIALVVIVALAGAAIGFRYLFRRWAFG